MDELKVTIKDDGSLKVETEKIGDVNHTNAERFLQYLSAELGVVPERQRKGHTHAHQHEHEHTKEKA
jgi:hypothetical protein